MILDISEYEYYTTTLKLHGLIKSFDVISNYSFDIGYQCLVTFKQDHQKFVEGKNHYNSNQNSNHYTKQVMLVGVKVRVLAY